MLFPYTLGIVVIMKNEGPYVKEWLDYHLNAGVDIVYLYDNDSTDGLEEIVSPYVEKGLVVYHKFPGLVPQLRCYNEALQTYRWTCKYLAFIDADEFIYPTNNGSIKDFVEEFFKGKDNISALYVYWILFGSAGEENADFSRSVLDRFRYRDKDTYKHGKVILNPRLTLDFERTPHRTLPLTGVLLVNELYEDVFVSNHTTGDKIFIAHFATKSKNEYIARHIGSDAFFGVSTHLKEDGTFNEETFKENDKNDVEDNRVFNYYLSNLKNPPPRKIKISECISRAVEILSADKITMEEFFYALHILIMSKLFSDELKDLCRRSFFKLISCMADMQENIIICSIGLFINELPFLVRCNIFDIKDIKALANSYYDILHIILLSNGYLYRTSLLHENKKWLDAL